MEPRKVAKIGRWAAAAAVAIVVVVAGILVHRAWLGSRAARHAPAAVPSSVEQRSVGFTYSKVEGQQTVFTVHAARATEFRQGNRTVLEDVKIIVYGEHGERHDVIDTRSCSYDPSRESLTCLGKVSVDMARAPAPGKPANPAASNMAIETRSVSFDAKTGEAWTNAPVTFRFPQGRGSALGVRYSTQDHNPSIAFGRNIELTLAPSRPGEPQSIISATGGLKYDRKSGRVWLGGPVKIAQGDRSLETSSLVVTVTDRLQPRSAMAGPGVDAQIDQAGRDSKVRADEADILFDPHGRAERVIATGHVAASQTGARIATRASASAIRMEAGAANVTLDPLSRQPREVVASGGVRLGSKSKDGTSWVETSALSMTMAPADPHGPSPSNGVKVQLAKASSPGQTEGYWQSSKERLRFEAGRMTATFGPGNELRTLEGAAGVQLERQQNGQPPVVANASTLHVDFSGGEWVRAEEAGNVRITQGEGRAWAERASLARAQQEMELNGNARVSNAMGQTLAKTISWNQETGEMLAAGNVRATYFAKESNAGDATPLGATGPANVVAERLQANSSTGDAVFSGRARLWQDDMIVQAERIELQKKSGRMIATGNVLGAFPQAAAARANAVIGKPATASGRKAGTKEPVLWRVRANRLTYANGPRDAAPKTAAGRATLEGGVQAWSSEGEVNAERMVLTLRPDARGQSALAQATGEGGVTVKQGDRTASGERAAYDVSMGKFVVSGGRPTLRDSAGDVVTGDRLTFYVADDTILIESSKGSRTVTRLPAPK